MKDFFEETLNNESKLAKKLNRIYLPNETEKKELSELVNMLECNNDINIVTKYNMFWLLSYAFMLGKDTGKRTERKKQKAKLKQLA